MSATDTVAFGLQLRASFALPGTDERHVPGLPELRIEVMSADGMELLWPGPWDEQWAGLLGDGHELVLEGAQAGERRFSYGDRARYVLSEEGQRLVCAPAAPGLHWQRTLLSKVVPAVSVMRGYEALHAAAVKAPYGAVAIAAPSGTGKSTLALELVRRGWPLMCDDVLALSLRSPGVFAHPGTPHMNVSSAGEQLPPGARTIGVLGGERWMALADAECGACPLAAVVLLERAEETAIERANASPLALAPFMLGVATDGQRRAQRFELFAELAESTPIFSFRAGPEHEPAALAGILRAALLESGALR